MLPGIALSTRVLLLFLSALLGAEVAGVVNHNSGVSMIFSATSLKASVTPTAVLAEVSMKREFMRRAKASPSDVGT
jgi:hypothetical protein